VTELEILYAALFYPHLAKSTAFYLRDPDYSHRNRLGDNEPLRDKVSENDVSAAHLSPATDV
jgi:hypothetical protein